MKKLLIGIYIIGSILMAHYAYNIGTDRMNEVKTRLVITEGYNG